VEELYSLKTAKTELSEEDVNLIEGLKELVEGKELTHKQKSELPDSAFAVVIKRKGKSGKIIKERKYPIRGTPDDKTRVRSALRYLGMPRNQEALRKLGVSVKSVLRKILNRAKELGMKKLLKRRLRAMDMQLLRKAVKKIRASRKEAELLKADLANQRGAVEDLKSTKVKYAGGIKNLANQVKGLKTKVKSSEITVASLKKEAKDTKDFYIIQARKVIERRTELGDFAKGLKDEDLADNGKFELAKAKKILAEKEAEEKKVELKTASLNVGDKEKADQYAKNREIVNKKAFG